tara:strand:- start:1121 stop:1483 length:363 start_codon:yes stop_codon:yes gene_type:complete
MKYLCKLFLKAEEKLKNNDYDTVIVNRKKFKKKFVQLDKSESEIFTKRNMKKYFVFNEDEIDEYICNLLIYKWLIDHKDKRYNNFTVILKPKNTQFDLKKVSFNELLHFISPQTKKVGIK